MATSETAAGRLHQLLSYVSEPVRRDVPLRVTLAGLYDLDANDRQDVLRCVVAAIDLPAEAEASVRALPNHDHDLLLRWVTPVQAAMNVVHQIDSSTASVAAHYNLTHLYALEMVADQVARNIPSPVLSEDTLTTANGQISELLETLEAIDDELARALLVRHASALQRALRLYRVTGADGVHEALFDAAFAVGYVQQRDARAPTRTAAQTFGALIAFIADGLTIAGVAYQLAPAINAAIGLIGK